MIAKYHYVIKVFKLMVMVMTKGHKFIIQVFNIFVTPIFVVSIFFTVLDAGLVGLVLSNTLSLTNVFQFCVRQSALVENQVC